MTVGHDVDEGIFFIIIICRTGGVGTTDMAAAVGGAAAEEAVMAGSEMTFERFLEVDDVTVTGGRGMVKKKGRAKGGKTKKERTGSEKRDARRRRAEAEAGSRGS